MVKHILRVDISEGASDFESAALEPGVPLLDRNNTNDNALRKSLGRLAAQPERKTVSGENKQEIVEFYVCDDQGGRLHDIECEPVTDSDLRKATSLKQDMEKLKKRLEQVEPAQLRNVLKGQLEALEQQGPAHRECHFFRYREGKTWNLVWCWGYQRKDLEPAHPRICTNPSCCALYVRRSQGSRTCPVCQGQAVATPTTEEKKSKAGLIAALVLLLLLLAGGGVYLMWPKPIPPPVPDPVVKFVAVPETWEGPAGGTVEFAVKRRKMQGDKVVDEEDLSQGAIAIVEHPKIVQFESGSLRALARAPGQAVIHFYLGNEQARATLNVQPPVNPTKIVLEPATVKLGIGATNQLHLFGEYPNGNRVDLSKSARWLPPEGKSVFSHEGWVEGLAAGKTEVKAKYRASSGEPFLEAVAAVEVEDVAYKSLKLKLDSTAVAPGDTVTPTVALVDGSGQEHSATKSSLLNLVVDTPDVANFNEEGQLVALQPGQATVTASWKDLKGTAKFEVKSSDTPARFEVKPNELALIVGEVAELDVTAPAGDPVEMASADPSVVEIVDGRLVGRAPGSTVVTVSQEARQQEVEVDVSAASIKSLAIVPDSVSLELNDAETLRVVATTEDDKQVDLAGDVLQVEQLPTASFVEFDPKTLTVRGLLPTEGSPQTVVLRLDDQQASAEIEVVSLPPGLITLHPSGEVELPVGQILPLQATVRREGTRDVEIPLENIQWDLNPSEVSGLEFDPETGVVYAAKEGAGPLVIKAEYQGSESEAVSVKSVPREDLALSLRANPSEVRVGTEGYVELVLADPDSDAQLSLDHVEYASSDDSILLVDPPTGGFLGVAPGEVTITATHPASANPASLTLQVKPTMDAPVKPTSLQITSDQGDSVLIPVGAKFGAYKVTAQYDSGETRDVTDVARLVNENADAENVSISIADRQIEGVAPGEAVVQAEFEGARTSDGLTIKVKDDVEIVAVEIVPQSVKLFVDESATLSAIGYIDVDGEKVPVGDITSSPDLTWKSQDESILSVSGPDVLGVAEGETDIIASIDDARGTAAASIEQLTVGSTEIEVLEIYPDRLRLQVGESKSIGSDITLKRDGVDFTPQASFTSNAPSVFSVDENRGIVSGVAPGQADLVITYGGQSETIPVEVVPVAVIDEDGTVVIEPATGTIAVGEAQPVRVFFQTESGQRIDRTGSAVLRSSDDAVLGVDGNRVIGLSAGDARIAARIPESDDWTFGQFRVVAVDYERLVISPPRIDMSVGDEAAFRVFGVGPNGRRELSDHPSLKVTAGGSNPTAIEIIGVSRVRGAGAGEATLDVSWGNSLTAQAPVRVTNDPWTDLRIAPADATVEVGDQTSFTVFARRGGRERALTVYDGVDLAVADPSIARFEGGFAVAGLGVGTTSVTARLGDMRAAARLNVVQPAPTPPGVRTGLRFIPDVLTLQLGTPGASVRLVHTLSGGGVEDVDHRAEMVIEDPTIVELEWTASGPIFRPLKVGQTRVNATYDKVAARRPLFVQVVAQGGKARLVVRPEPLRLNVGRTAEFSLVRIAPGGGRAPFDVNYQVAAAPEGIVDVVNGRVVRGLAPGTTTVTVTPVDVGPAFENLSATVTVMVNPTGSSGPPPNPANSNLVLYGPSSTTVGADAPYRVELVTPGGTSDVTNNATTLVLDRSQASLADDIGGCVLRAQQPGVVNVRAQHGGLISNPIRLRINPVITGIRRLELEISRLPMGVNESRPYRVWAYPNNQRPRQDVTNSAAVDLTPDAGVASVVPSHVVADAAGEFTMQAEFGGVQSNAVTLLVVDVPTGGYLLSANPPSVTIRVGELTPALEILASRPGARTTHINAGLEAQSDILAPSADHPGRFVGQRRGETAIRASSGGAETLIPVKVVGSPFRVVELGEVDLVGDNQFAVNIDIVGDLPAQGSRQYRAVPVASSQEVSWKTATVEADQVRARLKSPKLRIGPQDETYRLIIESRDSESGPVDRYPFDFRLVIEGRTP